MVGFSNINLFVYVSHAYQPKAPNQLQTGPRPGTKLTCRFVVCSFAYCSRRCANVVAGMVFLLVAAVVVVGVVVVVDMVVASKQCVSVSPDYFYAGPQPLHVAARNLEKKKKKNPASSKFGELGTNKLPG